MNLLRAEDGMETPLIGAGSSCRGDGGGRDWTAKVGPDLEGFECPTEEHSNPATHLPFSYQAELAVGASLSL